MPVTVFFCYARADSERVLPLARKLKAIGIDIWVDEWSLVVGKPWDEAVMAEIGAREAFLVALTAQSVTRDEVKNEIAEALRRDRWVIPVLFEPCVLPHRIARLHQCRMYPSFDLALQKLLKVLGMTFDAEARKQIDERRTSFIRACERPSNITHEDWTDPRRKFLATLQQAQRDDAPLAWFEVLEAGRELREVMSRVPEGDERDPHPGHAAPIFSPLVMLTDAIERNLSAAATGENLTGARPIGLLEQSVSEADRRLISERQKLSWLDRKGKAAIDRARTVIAEEVHPALEGIRATRDNVLVTAPDVVRRAVEAAAVAIGELVSMSDSLAIQAQAGLQQVKQAAGAFIDDTRRRFRAFRMVWTRSPATDALAPGPMPARARSPEDPVLGGEAREMTIMFSDVRSFSTISESYEHDPRGLTTLMNRFLTPLTNAILAHKGTVDKYMGDAIMAFWNAPLDDPEHQLNACEAALDMLDGIDVLNRQREIEATQGGYPFIPIIVSIGLNTGTCIVGNMGSDLRANYSVLGDSVNLASRLTGQSKDYGFAIIAGSKTALAVKDKLAVLELDSIMVKGKKEPELIYAIAGGDDIARSERFRRQRNLAIEMLACYRSRDWEGALEAIARGRRGDDSDALLGLCKLYEARIISYQKNPPPEDWNGTYTPP